MGDLFWFDDAYQSIALYEQGPVTLMTKKQSRADQVYQGSPYINYISWVDTFFAHKGITGIFRLAAMMRREQYTNVWILHKSWRYRLAAKSMSFGRQIGVVWPPNRCRLAAKSM